MVLINVWHGIDRVAFFENAILLELKRRSQGTSAKMAMSNTRALHEDARNKIYPHSVRDLLDDIALVASGNGGADNVTAACLEISDTHDRSLILRLAMNAGVNTGALQHINVLLQEPRQNDPIGSSIL